MKTCPRCHDTKPLDLFYLKKSGQPQSYCKDCTKMSQKEWARLNRSRKNDINRKWRAVHQDRRKIMMSATNLLWKEIRSGRIIRGQYCERCGSTEAIEGAHADYTKPLDVYWLCRPCHRQWDANEAKTA